jgi:hypothetical protein
LRAQNSLFGEIIFANSQIQKLRRFVTAAIPNEINFAYFFASASHFLIDAALAAPDKGFPALLSAFSSQDAATASLSHFLMTAALAAPASGLPFLSIALASQPESAATAEKVASANAVAISAGKSFM